MNAVMKTLSRAAVAVAAAVAASGAMAANGTVQLDTSVIAANSLTVSSLGADTYSSSTGVLTAPIDAANTTASLIDFGNNDGFSISLTVFFAKQTLSFTNFSYNVTNNTLYGTLLGSGSLLSGISFTGDLLTAGTTSIANSVLTASNFSVSSGLTSYLTSAGVSTSSLSAITSSIKSVNLPVTSTPAVPEPSTYAMLGLGLVGVALVARRKKQG